MEEINKLHYEKWDQLTREYALKKIELFAETIEMKLKHFDTATDDKVEWIKHAFDKAVFKDDHTIDDDAIQIWSTIRKL